MIVIAAVEFRSTGWVKDGRLSVAEAVGLKKRLAAQRMVASMVLTRPCRGVLVISLYPYKGYMAVASQIHADRRGENVRLAR